MSLNSSLRILAMWPMTIDFLLPPGQKLNPLVTDCMCNVYYTTGFSQGSLLRHNWSFSVSPEVLRGILKYPQASETSEVFIPLPPELGKFPVLG